jgi:TrmH family RNA methyltransferase
VIVTSTKNARIKQIRALASRKERERTGLFFAEGSHLVIEASQTQAAIELLVVAPELLRSSLASNIVKLEREAGRPILEVSSEIFRDLVARDLVQGIGAVVRQRWKKLGAIHPQREGGVVALAGTQYPGNLGTIIRTADAVGAGGIVLLDATSDPYDPIAVRASLGAIFTVPLARASFAEFVSWAAELYLPIVGTSPASKLDYRSMAYPKSFALPMGSEGHGLTPEQLATCDSTVSIPMAGRCDSLNLAVATGVILYEAMSH